MRIYIIIYLILTFSLSLNAQNGEYSYFDQQVEAPNLFLQEEHRTIKPDEIPAQVLEDKKALVNEVLENIFSHLVLPIVGEDGEMKNRRYFQYLQDNLDQEVKVLPSGGVLRSALSYIYQQLFNEFERNPDLNVDVFLKKMANQTESISSFDIRGVGSDFDVLLQGPEDKVGDAIHQVKQITNSAEYKFKLEGVRTNAKRNLFAVGDAKKYYQQIERSTKQGGASIDFLAFMLSEKGVKGHVIMPEGLDYIYDDFIKGVYRYLPPVSVNLIEDGQKQTIRGIRALFELPFLKV